MADHAGPTSRTLAPAASTAARKASLCAASTSATQLPSAPCATSTTPGASCGGAAPAPATRIRGATVVARDPLHPAVGHAQVARGRGQPDVVGADDQRAAPRRRGEQAVERRAGRVVQAGRRLVEDDDVGLARQRRREGDALALAVGERGERALERRGEGGGDVLAGVRLPAHPRQLAQPAAPGQPGDGGEALGRVAGAQPGGPRDAPARRRRDAGDEPQQGRLAHAVGALHGDDGARLQLEVDVAQDRRSRAVALGDLCELDQNAPRRDSTAGTVLTRIERSRNTDQRSR